MAGAKEIRTKIRSIQNTRKITKAMEMVAASKMRKAQERMQATRPYASKMRQVVRHLAHANTEYHHPYLQSRTVRRVGLIVVSTDRGLCGGLNVNLFRAMSQRLQALRQSGVEYDVALIGSKALQFFKRMGGASVLAETSHLGDVPCLADVIGPAKIMLDAYNEGRIDQLFVVYNEFVNTMTQRPRLEQLLPIEPNAADEEPLTHHWDYIYEPDARSVMDQLLMRYIESLVYQGVVENGACEQAARMVAMKAASDNAGNLIDELQLIYNKARQAAITQEISEIVSGAAAV